MKKEPILVVASMEDVELDYLKEKLEDIKIEKNEICTFYEGTMFGKDVVLCFSNVGTINAAASITFGAKKYAPKVIINEGIAGGVGEKIHVGDIVIGTEVIHINSLESKKRERGEGTNLDDYEITTFIYGEDNRLICPKSDEKLLELAKNVTKEVEEKTYFGAVGSGDIWNKEADRLLYLNEKYNIMCEEMESISIYKIADLYNIPVIAIKAISDNAILNEEYERKVGIKSQLFTERLIKEIK